MSKARSVVASVTQQSRQRVMQSRTEYRERPKATRVQTVRRADDQRQSVGDVSVPSQIPEHNRQLDTEAQTPHWAASTTALKSLLLP